MWLGQEGAGVEGTVMDGEPGESMGSLCGFWLWTQPWGEWGSRAGKGGLRRGGRGRWATACNSSGTLVGGGDLAVCSCPCPPVSSRDITVILTSEQLFTAIQGLMVSQFTGKAPHQVSVSLPGAVQTYQVMAFSVPPRTGSWGSCH